MSRKKRIRKRLVRKKEANIVRECCSDQPGLEFCLTGYENPGLQLPESIITWVAHRGMPDFMMNLRSACLKLRGQDQRSQEAAAKESPKVYPENSSYQQPMGQGRMYA